MRNHDFWNLQSFLILKHYLSLKIGWNKCLQEIVYTSVHYTILSHANLYITILSLLQILESLVVV